MDVHRCRFVPYPQSTINVLAFSHSHISKVLKAAPPRLAIGRANGDIEIWNPLNGAWLQETVIRGGKDRSIDGLVWIQDPTEVLSNGKWIIGKSRLFSVGCTTTITEWDLENGRPLRQASGNHGEIWCLAAQPPLAPGKKADGVWEGQNLVTGCTDGALVLYSTKDEDLQFGKILVRPSAKRAKIISVAFQNRDIVIAGCTDSTIRVYDVRSGQNLRTMSIGAGPKGGPKNIDIWAVMALPNGDIISGDSTGEMRIWSGKTYTLMQRVKSHNADIFTLAASHDGTTLFSGGKDRRTVVYKQVGKAKRWAEVSHRRYHDHDVTTMASLEYKGMSVMVSGGKANISFFVQSLLICTGPDASPMVVPLQQFGMDFQRALPFLPQEAPVKSALMGKKRLLMSFWDREIRIWELSKPTTHQEDVSDENHTRKLVSKILIKGEASITSADLISDGSLLAVSTTSEIKVFQLRPKKSVDGETNLKVSTLQTPHGFMSGARLVRFSPDRKWLCIVRTDSQIVLRRLTSSSASIKFHPRSSKLERVNRKIEKHIILGGLGTYDRTVTQAAFSANSNILAVSDLAGYIDTFVLSGQEDLSQELEEVNDASSSDSSDSEPESDEEESPVKLTYGQYWTRNPSASSIPKLPSAPTVLSFRPATAGPTNGVTSRTIATRQNPNPVPHDLPSGEDRLIVVTATSEVFEFEVLQGSLSTWSRRNPTSSFPTTFRKVRDLAKGCFWDVSNGRQRLWLYGSGWLFMFDLATDFPDPMPDPKESMKRKRHGKEESSGAGSRVPDVKLGTGISRKMTKLVHGELMETEQVPLRPREEFSDDEDMALERLPRETDLEKKDESDAPEENYWKTFKYRPILGMCAFGDGEPEVAIVERPLWEADLPEKFYGNQEWESSGV